MDNAEDQVPKLLLLADLAQRVRERLDKEVRRISSLTLPQALVLCRVDLAGGRVSIGQIATELGRGPSTLSGIVDGLEAKHLVARERDVSGDGCLVLIVSTERGEEQLARYRSALRSLVLELLADDDGSSTGVTLDEATEILSRLAG